MATDGSTLFVAPAGATGAIPGMGVEAWNTDATVNLQGGAVTGPVLGCTSVPLQQYFSTKLCPQPDAYLAPFGFSKAQLGGGGLGYTVGVGGGFVVFGWPQENAAYVFKEPMGGFHGQVTGQTATLVPATGASDPHFGATVAISSHGGEIAVRVPDATVAGHAGQGDVLVYREPNGGWQGGTSATTESQDFVASHGAAGDRLGLNTDLGVIGLAGEQTLAIGGGEVFAGSPLKGSDEPVYAFSTEFPLTVTMAGGGSGTVAGESVAGSVDCTSTCSTDLWRGEPLALTATPASGSTFRGWSEGGCSGTGTCAVTASSATSVTATFTHTINQTGPTTATVADGGTYTGHLAVTGASFRSHMCGESRRNRRHRRVALWRDRHGVRACARHLPGVRRGQGRGGRFGRVDVHPHRRAAAARECAGCAHGEGCNGGAGPGRLDVGGAWR